MTSSVITMHASSMGLLTARLGHDVEQRAVQTKVYAEKRTGSEEGQRCVLMFDGMSARWYNS